MVGVAYSVLQITDRETRERFLREGYALLQYLRRADILPYNLLT